ncbi:MAG: phosphoribosylaminoimidazolesuccinocarboxamide synthase [Saprospiraceae bacterium]
MSAQVLEGTAFQLGGQTNYYKGKVRDVYTIGDKMVMIATDRISAFDYILPRAIPYKGQVLNQVAIHFLKATEDICPNWLEASPDPNVAVGIACQPFKVEMVIRGYLTGHAWREYQAGRRVLCGVPMPDGMQENQAFPAPIITPATKADEGHDEDISKEEIIRQGIVSEADYLQLEQYTHALFQRGTEMAAQQGLILVDTKYEFGKKDGTIYLIDEIHTPDSSRYFYADTYHENQKNREKSSSIYPSLYVNGSQPNNFQGLEGQTMPVMDDALVNSISERYIELFERVTGRSFDKADTTNILQRVEQNIKAYLEG